MKNFEEFAKDIKECLQEKYPDAVIETSKIVKNNDESLIGITIRANGEDIAPNIYLNEYYTSYVENKMTVDEITLMLQKVYSNACKDNESINIDTSIFRSKEKLLEKVILKLLSIENNTEYLKGVVYYPVMEDLAAVVYVHIDSSDKGIMTSKLQQKYFEMLDIDKEELYKIALSNTESFFPVKTMTMFNLMSDMADEALPTNDELPMYVITNKMGVNGATACLYPDALKNFCDEQGFDSIYILPSSVHELILIPEKLADDVEYLKKMVEEVNATVVLPADILSNSVYKYDYETDTVSKIK